MLIQHNISLKTLNSFGLDVKAASLAHCTSASELQKVLTGRPEEITESMILGGGSNVLFLKDYEGLVILNRIMGMQIEAEDANHVWLRCGAGEIWDDVVRYAVEHHLGGIENLSIIPGRCGAAPMQNIGAYGVELREVFESLQAVELDSGELREFSAEECEFGYRESIFKHKVKGQFVITSLLLRLNKKHSLQTEYGAISDTLEERKIAAPTISDIRDAVIHIRTSKLPDPAVLGNAGSFFKNPEVTAAQFEVIRSDFENIPHYPLPDEMIKIPAGWMIEQCGWKGKKIGKTGAHARQALVLVNYGGASGKEIYKLAMDIRASVMDKFGVEINPEVNIIS